SAVARWLVAGRHAVAVRTRPGHGVLAAATTEDEAIETRRTRRPPRAPLPAVLPDRLVDGFAAEDAFHERAMMLNANLKAPRRRTTSPSGPAESIRLTTTRRSFSRRPRMFSIPAIN